MTHGPSSEGWPLRNPKTVDAKGWVGGRKRILSSVPPRPEGLGAHSVPGDTLEPQLDGQGMKTLPPANMGLLLLALRAMHNNPSCSRAPTHPPGTRTIFSFEGGWSRAFLAQPGRPALPPSEAGQDLPGHT